MSLADCLKKLKIDSVTAAEIESQGLAGYEAGLMGDLESLRAQLTSLGFEVSAVSLPTPTTRELFQSMGDAKNTPEFKEWFGDSKVVDESGEPLVVYHGTKANVDDDFAFDYTRIGEQGRAEGAGFYFTSDKGIAGGYGHEGSVISAYMAIDNPISFNQEGFDNNTLKKIIKEIAEQESIKEEMEIGDGFLSNFGDVNYQGLDSTIQEAANLIVGDDNALDQISGIVGSGVDIEVVNRAVNKITGHDGVITEGFSDLGVNGGRIYVAFFPEQVKSTNNKGAFSKEDPRILFQSGTEDAAGNDLLMPVGETASMGAETMILDTPDLKIMESDYLSATSGRMLRYVRYDNGKPIGALQIRTKGKRSKKAIIANVFVKPEHRRSKVASGLLRRSQEDYDVKHSDDLTDIGRKFASADGVFYQKNRASIQFGPSGTTINLGLGSDRSSFLHESGHLFLEQLRQDQIEFGTQNEQLVDDWNTVTKWWGKNASALKQEAIELASKSNDDAAVKALAGLSNKKVKEFVETGDLDRSKDAQGYLSIAMHEQWARGVEDYFRTGQAPSVALQDAFNRFRAWLVSIYKKSAGLDIQFSPDVRAVMDRLLATDEEIDLVASQFDMKAMFESAEEIGMTPSQFKNYQRDVARSVQEGKTKQLKKHLNEVERERQKWWMDERNKIMADVAEETHQLKEYQLMYALTNGTKPSGEPLTRRHNRLDRRAINLIMENDESAKRLPKIKNKVLYATAKKEGSAHPDVVASAYGYTGGREMLIELMNVQPMEDVINAETDARMKAKHGDMQLPDQAEAAAVESIHGDKRGEVLIAEVNALREGQQKMKSAFVRQWAKEQIGKHKVDNIKPTKFLAAEKRYAKLAAKEFKAGNMLEAQRAKFRQMMNHFMAKESYKVREEMNKSRNYMQKFNKKKATFKSIDADYIDRIQEILGSYQLGPRLSEKKKLVIELAAFNQWIHDQEENEGAILNIPQEILDANEKTHYRDLSLDEFRTLSDSIRNIEAQGRLKKKALISGELRDIKQMEDDIMARLDILPTKAVEAAKAIRQDANFKDKATERFHSFDASLRKVEFLLEYMDGEANGPAHEAFFQTAADAEDMKNDIVKEVNEVFMEKLEALPKEVRKHLGKDTFIKPLGRSMNRGNLLMMALNIGNESNLDKMIRGSEQEGANWTEENITEALKVLTKEEWDFVQAVWDAFDKIYPQVQEIYRRENGVSPEKIESKTIETKHGDYTGRYFPMMYDPRRSAMSRDLEGKTALEAMQSQVTKAGVFSGMTKARTNFAAPVLLDISAVPNHVRRMAHYVSHYETVRLTRRLLSRKKLSTAITEKLGESYYRELKAWMGDVAADGQTDKVLGFWDKAIEAMRTNVTIAIMGFSYTTGASQLLGHAQSIDALAQQADGTYKPHKGALDLAWAIKRSVTEKGIVENIMEVSGQMRHRVDNIDRDLKHAMKQLSGKRGVWKKMQRSTLMHIAYIQFYMVDIPVWIASQDKALKEGKSESQAIKFADGVVRKTQTSGGTKDLANIQRQRGLMNAHTMFYSFFSLLYNIQARALGDVKAKPRDIGRFTARAMVILVLPTALEALMRGEKPDDEEDYIRWLALKSVLYAATSIAFVRDLVGLAEGFGYSSSPLDSIPKEMAKAVREIAQAVDEGEMTKEAAIKALAAAGYAFGFPVLQPKRLIEALDKWEDDGSMPRVVEFLRGTDDD